MTTPAARPTPPDALKWWRRAVVYQVYIRSFADADGDGIGDIAGLRDRLPYLRDLGVDAVWINPWYPSPLLDGGYDVADYRAIDPRLGTLADAEELVVAAHELGIRVLADLVPNHTSWDHEWFQEALAASPGDEARDRYIFRDGLGDAGERPPNNWTSFFGGPAWTRVEDGQWYLHLFDTSQPDLNWERDDVRDEFHAILRFWLDRGIDGFRVDVAHSLAKAPGLPDVLPPHEQNEAGAHPDHPYLDRDELHEIVRGWRAVLDEYDDRVMIAEAYVHRDRLPLYIRQDEYHQAFNFQFLDDGWRAHQHNLHAPAAVAAAAQHDSAATWVLSNHDQVRHATRFALPEADMWFAKDWLSDGPRSWLHEDVGQRRARAAALLMLALPGSVYLYQGEELGLPEAYDLPPDVLQDPEASRSERKGRDGCRVPIPWERDAPSFGFGDTDDPWLPQPPVFGDLAVDQQQGRDGSMLELYRTAISLRRERLVEDEDVEFLDLGRDVVAFRRGTGLTCVVNMGRDPVELPDGQVLLASRDGPPGSTLAPDDGVWLVPS